jgi:hypothetical protein
VESASSRKVLPGNAGMANANVTTGLIGMYYSGGSEVKLEICNRKLIAASLSIVSTLMVLSSEFHGRVNPFR